MEVEVLLSTMNGKDKQQIKKLKQKMKITSKTTVINQITEENIDKTLQEEGNLRIYSYNEKGLSKSRNIALNKLTSDIGIITDDDVIYSENYEEIIKRAYEKHPYADIIAFNVESKNPERPIRKQKTHKVNFISAMRIRSVQITFKKGINIAFDEEFGAGGKYNFGEERIWLYDCIKAGKKIYYVDEEIGQVLQKESTWYSKKDRNLMKCEGAVFYRTTKRFYLLMILQYVVRKRREYKQNMNIIKAVKYLFEGAMEYKNLSYHKQVQ